MKFNLLLAFCIVLSHSVHAQDAAASRIHIGFELDVLPFATGGYFGALWAGKGHWRARVLTADVNKPDWSTTEGFTNHHVTAYALVADYFLKPDWKGWWIGAGPVYWRSDIQTDARLQTARFENILLNGSIGYNLKLPWRFYLSPWAGLSIRAGGDKEVPVDGKVYTLPFLNPEASIKLGWYF